MKLAVISNIKGKGSEAIVGAAKKYFTKADHLDIKKISVHIHKDSLRVYYEQKELPEYDCIYLRGSYKYALLNRSVTRALHHKVYMPLQPQAFALAHNKLLTLLELQKNNILVPYTYFAATPDLAKELLREVKYPIILKIPEGGLGRGVVFAESEAAAKSMIDALELFKQPYLIQEFIETKDETPCDLRVIVVGGKIAACMKRFAAKEEIRANIHAKGRGVPHKPSPEVEQISIKTAKLIGADICAVDVLEGIRPAVLEANISPGLAGITKYTKNDVADNIAKMLYERTKQFAVEKQKKPNIQEIVRDLKNESESLISLNIINGIIKLPKYVADITGFTVNDEVMISAKKGEFKVKEHIIKKEE